MIITVDCNKWSRPLNKPFLTNALLVTEEKVEGSQPMDSDYEMPKVGTMCCLGFASLQAGATREEIAGKSYPCSVNRLLPGLNRPFEIGEIKNLETAPYQNTEFSAKAGRINDDPDLTDEERRRELSEMALSHGHEFVFINVPA